MFHRANSGMRTLFEVELAAFARAVGVSPIKQIVLVLDRAGWRTSVHPTRRNHSRPSTRLSVSR